MGTPSQWLEMPVAEEFEGAKLGDARRTRRLQRVATSAGDAPGVGFPQMVADDSELEGVYRFLSNEDVDAEQILEPHVVATLGRARQAGFCLVIHDTTDFRFGGEHRREGLGHINSQKQQGFFAHFALAVLPGEERVPLGVCGLMRHSRQIRKGTRRKSWWEMSKDPTRESLRWAQLLTHVEARREGFECVHLMDREGDIYDLMVQMGRIGARFVVRATHDRALSDGGRLSSRLNALQPQAFRSINIAPRVADRSDSSMRKHPPRKARSLQVAVAGTRVLLRRTLAAHEPELEVAVNVVHVWEVSPPRGQPEVAWVLYTSEPIETSEELLAVVDHYRSRWLIEEYFKALKTGCKLESRQLESYHALSNALSLFVPIAWKILLARALSRALPNAPAGIILSSAQLELLTAHLELGQPPRTAEQVAFAIAKLGGHLRRNGLPGWQTLGRGFERLFWMHAGWLAANRPARSDQS
jgi:Transposase DNA-binding/Transposase DDE domain